MTDFMKSKNMEEDMAEDRHLWRLGVDALIAKSEFTIPGISTSVILSGMDFLRKIWITISSKVNMSD